MFKDISDPKLRVTLAPSLLDEFFPIWAWDAHWGHFLLWCWSNAPWCSTPDAHAAAALAWRLMEEDRSVQPTLRSTREPYQCILVVPAPRGLFHAVGYSAAHDVWGIENVLAQMAPFVGQRTRTIAFPPYEDVA